MLRSTEWDMRDWTQISSECYRIVKSEKRKACLRQSESFQSQQQISNMFQVDLVRNISQILEDQELSCDNFLQDTY